MREVKFKIWDKAKKNWLTDRERCFIDEDGYIFIEKNSYSGIYLERVDGEIVWFTGLKDKNGIEIYEGDIVKTANNGYLRVIVWDHGAFHSRVLNYEPNKDMPSHPVHFWGLNSDLLPEVCGNIHEHPHLLNPISQ